MCRERSREIKGELLTVNVQREVAGDKGEVLTVNVEYAGKHVVQGRADNAHHFLAHQIT